MLPMSKEKMMNQLKLKGLIPTPKVSALNPTSNELKDARNYRNLDENSSRIARADEIDLSITDRSHSALPTKKIIKSQLSAKPPR